MNQLNLSYNDIHAASDKLIKKIKRNKIDFDFLIAVGRGGFLPATILGYHFKKPVYNLGVRSYNDEHKQLQNAGIYQDVDHTLFDKSKTVLVVDDLVDSGQTVRIVRDYLSWSVKKMIFASLFVKGKPDVKPDIYVQKLSADKWVSFPYERNYKDL